MRQELCSPYEGGVRRHLDLPRHHTRAEQPGPHATDGRDTLLPRKFELADFLELRADRLDVHCLVRRPLRQARGLDPVTHETASHCKAAGYPARRERSERLRDW